MIFDHQEKNNLLGYQNWMEWKCACATALAKGICSVRLSVHHMCNETVPDQVGTLAQDVTIPNMGWPNKELTTGQKFPNWARLDINLQESPVSSSKRD